MTDSGEYDTPFRWDTFGYAAATSYSSTGDKTYTDQGTVWGRFPVASSNRQNNLNTAPTNTQNGTAILRELLAIKSGDRLTDLETDVVWEVVSVAKDRTAYETTCELKGLR